MARSLTPPVARAAEQACYKPGAVRRPTGLAWAPAMRHTAGMASDRKTVDFIVEQIARAGEVSARAMFGEYGVYCDGKMVGIVGDDRLFLRPTPGGRAFAAGAGEAAPYPGAKAHLLIDADRWDDGEWMSELVRITCAELPLPRPKKRKRSDDPAARD